MAEIEIIPYIGTRTPADFDTLFDELEAARGSSASLSDAIAEKADNATTLSGYGITDAYTKTETDTALSGKQDELSQSQLDAANSGITAAKLTGDEAVLVELVDSGAKNLIYPNSASGTAIEVCNIQKHIKSDRYHLYFTAENYSGNYQLNFYDIDNQYIDGGLNGNIASIKSIDFALNKDAYRVKFIISGTADIANLMLCTAADWTISQAYQPYRPSWQEMYQMILALQNGTRSAPALAKAELEEIKETETGEEEMR